MRILKHVLFVIAAGALKLKWKIFGAYYNGLLVQASFLYRQSELYKERRLQMGLDFAEECFKEDVVYFFHKACQEPILIRTQIFLDAACGREPVAYYLEN